jgi:hypothetical protein
MKIIWHEKKKDMPKAMSVPENEIHLWYKKNKNHAIVEVRGIPLTYDVTFYSFNIDKGAVINLKPNRFFSNESIENFNLGIQMAREEAKSRFC